jgi:DNA-binding transcriptional regulator YiaG
MQGSEVRALRKSLGASYTGFAEALGVARSTVQWWEIHGADNLASIFLHLLRDKPAVWKWLVKHASQNPQP